jgi:hypothetical protein
VREFATHLRGQCHLQSSECIFRRPS